MASDTEQTTDKTYGAANVYGNSKSFPDLPGDVKLSADGGASLLIGKEGLIKLQASPMAQIVLGALMNFCRIVCREFEINTDFGSLKFSNGTNGYTGLLIEGGSQYADETIAGSGTSTARISVGTVENNPDARLGISVNSTDSSEVGGFVIGKDGMLTFGTSNDYLLSIGGDAETLCQGDNYHEINGTHKVQIDGKLEEVINQTSEIYNNSDKSQAVAGDYNLQVNGTLGVAANNITFASISGDGGCPITVRCSSLNIVKA